MKTINARRNGPCSKCSNPILVGQTINYGDGQGTRHAACEGNARVTTGVTGPLADVVGGNLCGSVVRIKAGPRRGLTGTVKWAGTRNYDGERKDMYGLQIDGYDKLVYTTQTNVVPALTPFARAQAQTVAQPQQAQDKRDHFAGTALPGRLTAVATDDLRQELGKVESDIAALLTRRDDLKARIEAAEKAEAAERARQAEAKSPAGNAILDSYKAALVNARAAGDAGAVAALEAAVAAMEAGIAAEAAAVASGVEQGGPAPEAPAFIELTDPRVAQAPEYDGTLDYNERAQAADDMPF